MNSCKLQFPTLKVNVHTFALVPLNTVFRSLSSTSFCLIFLTTSTSSVSATYRRLAGDAIDSAIPNDADGVESGAAFRSGDPGGVVDSTAAQT